MHTLPLTSPTFPVLRWLAPVVLALFSLLPTSCMAQAGELIELDRFPKTTLEIRGAGATHRFDVWVAVTPQQQSQGLMFVRDLPETRGMLFLARPPRVFSMWMKNTFIPLDMVFIAPDGRVVRIAENTTPHSLETVSSGVEVGAVLELKGGEAARRALRVGDRVSWKPLP